MGIRQSLLVVWLAAFALGIIVLTVNVGRGCEGGLNGCFSGWLQARIANKQTLRNQTIFSSRNTGLCIYDPPPVDPAPRTVSCASSECAGGQCKPQTTTTTTPTPTPPSTTQCFVGGCSGQTCSNNPKIGTICEHKVEYACYRTAQCEVQQGGQCGWTVTSALQACLTKARSSQKVQFSQ